MLVTYFPQGEKLDVERKTASSKITDSACYLIEFIINTKMELVQDSTFVRSLRKQPDVSPEGSSG